MTAAMDSAPGPMATSHHSLPASPTLTNPDMILPDYGRSPSPVDLEDPMHSPLMMWRGAQAGHDSGNASAAYTTNPPQFHALSGGAAVPSTPIIYGNGTMLSDIGEVTEVESTLGKPSPPRYRSRPAAATSPGLRNVDSDADAALRSSPTIKDTGAAAGVKKRAKAAQRERRSSSDSNSTVTDARDRVRDQAPVFADFDDTMSVGDSVFQGDDEESMASSYVDDSSLVDEPPLISPRLNRDSSHKYTTAQLSRRAEQILANAKKRLTLMEDNLSRARTSLVVGSPISESTASTPSPSTARASTGLLLSTTGSSSPASGHHRMGSDNMLRIGLPIKVYPQRSSSVLGVSTAPRHKVLTVSKSADQLNGQYNRQRTSYIMRDPSLEPLGENDVSQPSRRVEGGTPKRLSAMMSPTFGVAPSHGLSRSASTSQMNDLKHQVQDLKGKISSLREQARADNLKRRSLQTLRTPSPFTHAQIKHWYSGTEAASGTTSLDSSSPRTVEMTSENSHRYGNFEAPEQAAVLVGLPDDSLVVSGGVSFDSTDQLELDSPGIAPYEADAAVDAEDDNEDLVTENGDVEEEEDGSEYEEAIEEGYDMVSESGDSIYHESVQNQLSHEDREDAFDYEHFFLHSAMGTISQRMARRDSDASFTSEESVETARGPLTEETDAEDDELPALTRRTSEDSVSTIETFTTAEEGVSRQGSLDLSRPEEEDDIERGEEEQEREGEDRNEQEDRVEAEPFPVLYATGNTSDRADTPPTAKRATFAESGPGSTVATQAEQKTSRLDSLHSATRRPMSSAAVTRAHATSVSSVASSTGTTRSFPLVNRNRQNSSSGSSGSSGNPTPDGGSSTPSLKTTSSLGIRSGSASLGHKTSISMHSTGSATSLIEESGTAAVMETLPRDDQFLVERLVASLGRCVLGLTESSRASTEARMYRRRIDAARKILEGMEPA